MQSATSTYLERALFGTSAVPLWARWSVTTWLAAKLDAWDVTALRFEVACLQLLPVVICAANLQAS